MKLTSTSPTHTLNTRLHLTFHQVVQLRKGILEVLSLDAATSIYTSEMRIAMSAMSASAVICACQRNPLSQRSAEISINRCIGLTVW
jgi:hypothetical protein